MWDWRRLLIIVSLFSLLSLVLVPQGVQGYTIIETPGPGGGGLAAFSFEDGGHILLNVTGTEAFDLYIMTEENFNRFTYNSSFGYIDRLSSINVTSTVIEGDLPAGDYVWLLFSYGAGNFTVWDQQITPTESGLEIPWLMVFFVIILVCGTAGLTYFLTRRRYG